MFNNGRFAFRMVLGTAAVVAAFGIAVIAYGTASNPTSTSSESMPLVTSAISADAVAVVATQSDLNQIAADGIAFMREEEKLARDVYLTLSDTWDLRIFANIARAEQVHMDQVLRLIDTYALQDPVGDNEIGAFTNPELQVMYDELVASGSVSIESALDVGALIEEVDIEDLVIYLEADLPADVASVYERLLSGSENHLRAFVSQLEQTGASYQPTVLTTDAYLAIISSDTQRGGDSTGNQRDGHKSDRGPSRGAGRGGRNA